MANQMAAIMMDLWTSTAAFLSFNKTLLQGFTSKCPCKVSCQQAHDISCCSCERCGGKPGTAGWLGMNQALTWRCCRHGCRGMQGWAGTRANRLAKLQSRVVAKGLGHARSELAPTWYVRGGGWEGRAGRGACGRIHGGHLGLVLASRRPASPLLGILSRFGHTCAIAVTLLFGPQLLALMIAVSSSSACQAANTPGTTTPASGLGFACHGNPLLQVAVCFVCIAVRTAAVPSCLNNEGSSLMAVMPKS